MVYQQQVIVLDSAHMWHPGERYFKYTCLVVPSPESENDIF